MQPTEQPQHPIDYLNSIAAAPEKANKKGDMLFFGALIAIVLVALSIGMFTLLGSGASSADDMARLSVRLSNLQAVADASQKNIVSSKLRGTNTSLSLTLTNAARDIAEPLVAEGADPKKISGSITSSESLDTLSETLEDARLNAVFDRTYAREMNYQLETTLALLGQIESTAKKDATRTYASTTKNNLQPLQKQFAEFTTTISED